jgi:DNA-binding NarL/FixJ family response regulator
MSHLGEPRVVKECFRKSLAARSVCVGRDGLDLQMKRGTVLLADRHSPMLEGVRSLLEERCQSVVMVADESSLLQAAEKMRPEMAVVDVSFPVGGAKNAVGLLRERFPDMKLIALSVYDDSVAVDRILSIGASAFVLKRSAATDLSPALDAVIAGRTYVSPGAKSHLKGPHIGDQEEVKNRIKKPGKEGAKREEER